MGTKSESAVLVAVSEGEAMVFEWVLVMAAGGGSGGGGDVLLRSTEKRDGRFEGRFVVVVTVVLLDFIFGKVLLRFALAVDFVLVGAGCT